MRNKGLLRLINLLRDDAKEARRETQGRDGRSFHTGKVAAYDELLEALEEHRHVSHLFHHEYVHGGGD